MSKYILSGHVSGDTAFVVDDYPYGWSLRCKIRYWLEFKKGKGVRMVSQTTNPKRGGIWNRPKASTYADVAGAMFLDDKGHVNWSALGYYPSAVEIRDWLAIYAPGCCAASLKAANDLLVKKDFYERAKATGMDYRYAGIVATLAATGLPYEEALARVNVGVQKAAAAAALNIIIEIPASPAAYPPTPLAAAVDAQKRAIANGATGEEAAIYRRPTPCDVVAVAISAIA